MKKNIFIMILCFASCKMHPDSDREYANKNGNVYKLHLNPASNSKYHFDISNESEIKMELNDKKMDNISRTSVGILYNIQKDSAGDFMFNMSYDKIKLYSKNGDAETEYSADNAATSTDLLEKMLGALTTESIHVTMDPTGVVKSVSGFKEMAAKLMSGFKTDDTYGKNLAQQRLERLIGDGVIRKNMAQLFKIFPDSAVHVGDKWKLDSKQNAELNLTVNSIFKLKEIKDDLAIIESEGEMLSDSAASNLMGYEVTANLKGKQYGTYSMNVKTGMLVNSEINGTVEGTLELAGREVPISIETKVKMFGRKEN